MTPQAIAAQIDIKLSWLSVVQRHEVADFVEEAIASALAEAQQEASIQRGAVQVFRDENEARRLRDAAEQARDEALYQKDEQFRIYFEANQALEARILEVEAALSEAQQPPETPRDETA